MALAEPSSLLALADLPLGSAISLDGLDPCSESASESIQSNMPPGETRYVVFPTVTKGRPSLAGRIDHDRSTKSHRQPPAHLATSPLARGVLLHALKRDTLQFTSTPEESGIIYHLQA